MIIYRYLFLQYLKILVLCVLSLIAVLMTTRLEEIARFAALGAPLSGIFWFGLYQLPYIFPIVLPISGLIASMILIQRLSNTQEITALRASGLPLKSLFAPVLIAATVLSLLNFYVVSELATHSHLKSRELKHYARSVNPLLLVQNKHLARVKGVFAEALGPVQSGDVKQLLLAFNNKHTGRLQLLTTEQFSILDETFRLKRVSQVGSFGPYETGEEDNLFLENIDDLTTDSFSFPMPKTDRRRKIPDDYLKTSLLFLRINELQNLSMGSWSELIRRVSIALAVFTFTLMGCAFGMRVQRQGSAWGIFAVIALASLFLVSYFSAKSIDKKLMLSATLYLLPHLMIIFSSLFMLKRVRQGVA